MMIKMIDHRTQNDDQPLSWILLQQPLSQIHPDRIKAPILTSINSKLDPYQHLRENITNPYCAGMKQGKQSKLTICTAILGGKIISNVKKTSASAHLFFVGLDVEHVPVEQNQLLNN